MLESILMVTMLVTNLSVTEQAYDDYLGYDTVVEGNVNEKMTTLVMTQWLKETSMKT